MSATEIRGSISSEQVGLGAAHTVVTITAKTPKRSHGRARNGDTIPCFALGILVWFFKIKLEDILDLLNQ